jgi:hypothetical protein
VILRMLSVRHLYDLSFEQTELQVAESLILRLFSRVKTQPSVKHVVINGGFQRAQPVVSSQVAC